MVLYSLLMARQERGIFRRGWEVLTGRTRLEPSVTEADRYRHFISKVVSETFKKDPRFKENPDLAEAFFSAAEQSAVELVTTQQERDRKRLLVILALGITVIAPIALQPIIKSIAELQYKSDLEFEKNNRLTHEPSTSSASGWYISHPMFSPKIEYKLSEEQKFIVRSRTTIEFTRSLPASSDGIIGTTRHRTNGKRVPEFGIVRHVNSANEQRIPSLPEDLSDPNLPAIETSIVQFTKGSEQRFYKILVTPSDDLLFIPAYPEQKAS